MTEESDPNVYYFYLSYLTGTKPEMAFKTRFEFGMKRGRCPFLPFTLALFELCLK